MARSEEITWNQIAEKSKETFDRLADSLDTTVQHTGDFTASTKITEEGMKLAAEMSQNWLQKLEKLAAGISKFSNLLNTAAGILGNLGIIGEKTLKTVTGMISGVDTGITRISDGFGKINKTGATLLDKIGGAVGALSGAVSIGIGVFKGFLSLLSGKSGELKAAERGLKSLSSALGTSLDEWAKKIEKLAKEIGGVGSAERALAYYLADIITSTDVTAANFDIFIQKIRDIGATMMWTNATIEETSKNYGAAFAALLPAAEQLGKVGGAAFIGLIENAKALGLQCQEIEDFVKTNITDAFEGWKDAVKVFGNQSIPVFDAMLHKEEIMAKIPETLKTGIEGATRAITGLSNAQRLTQDEFSSFNNIAISTKQQLENLGITGEDAIIAMAPLLERIAFLQKEFGYTVDATTQAMIDQGLQAGILTGDNRETNQIMVDGFRDVTGAIRELSSVLRGDFTGAFKEATNQVRTSTGIMGYQLSSLQGNIHQTVDDIGKMGNAIKSVDDDFVRSISGNTIIPELLGLQETLVDTIDITDTLGKAILPVHNTWINSSVEMEEYLTGIQERISGLQDILDKYKGKLTALQEQEKAGNEAELAALEALLKAREDALKISENLGETIFNYDNFDEGVNNIYGIFDALEKGNITLKETADELGSSFNTMIENAKNLGIEGSKSILSLIQTTKDLGINVPEISKYIDDQLKTGISSYGDYLSTFTNTGKIKETIANLENELANLSRGRGNNARRQEIINELAKQNQLLSGTIEDVKKNFSSMETYGIGMFNSLIAEGATFMEALQTMGPQFSQLSKIAKDNGIEVSGALKEILDMQDFLDNNQELATRINSTTKMMETLGNTGYLTKDIFTQFQKDAQSQFDELAKKTGNVKQAYQMIGPELGKLAWYSQQYGYTLDDNTKKLIREAQQHGVNMNQMIPPQEKMVALMEELVTVLGGKIPYAMNLMNNASQDSIEKIQADTVAWKNELGKVEKKLKIDLPAAGKALDREYTDTMTGHSIVTQTKLWSCSLNYIQKLIDKELPEAISRLDGKYSHVIGNLDEYLENTSKEGYISRLSFGEMVNELTRLQGVYETLAAKSKLSKKEENILDDTARQLENIKAAIDETAPTLENFEKHFQEFKDKLSGDIKVNTGMIEIAKTLRKQGLSLDEIDSQVKESLTGGIPGLDNLLITSETQEEFNTGQNILMKYVNSLQKEGYSLSETMKMIAEPLDNLNIRFDLTGPLKGLTELRQKMQANETLMSGLEGLQTAVRGVGDSMLYLDKATMKDFEKSTLTTLEKLKKSFTDKEALQLISPVLGDLKAYSQEYNLKLSPEIQKLLEDAQKEGYFQEKAKTETEKLVNVNQELIKVMENMIDVFENPKNNEYSTPTTKNTGKKRPLNDGIKPYYETLPSTTKNGPGKKEINIKIDLSMTNTLIVDHKNAKNTTNLDKTTLKKLYKEIWEDNYKSFSTDMIDKIKKELNG